MAATTEDGTVHFLTVDNRDIIADNIDTITLERVRATDPSEDDTYKVLYSKDGEQLGPVWVSYHIYCSLRALERQRTQEVSRHADTLE